MFPLLKIIILNLPKKLSVGQIKKCHSIFGIKDLMYQEKPENMSVVPVTSSEHELAVAMIKQHYLSEHVLVKARCMNLCDDRAFDEYLISIIKQGNSLYAKDIDGSVVGICVNFACSPVDPKNLRNYAFYRQDPNTKDFLYFTAKLQETPNLWESFQQPKIFEIKMLTVVPEYRRQGLAVMLAEKSKELAHDQGYRVVRMDCINPHDYKVAERCMMECIVKFPLHRIRSANAPFIKRSSPHNCCVRVYVGVYTHGNAADTDNDRKTIKQKQAIVEESLIE